MHIHSQTKQFILATSFFVVSLIGFFLLYSEIQKTEKISSEKLAAWSLEAARREEIKSLDNLMKNIEGEKVLIDGHFAQSSNPVPFLDTLENLASSVGAKNTVSAISVTKDSGSLVVEMNASGNFESFYKFMTLLETSPYGLEFMSVNMNKGDTSGEWTAILKVKLITFVK